jgi:hypothetical protein
MTQGTKTIRASKFPGLLHILQPCAHDGTALANAVVENTKQFHIIYVPPFLKKGKFLFFAIDNRLC